MDRNFGKEIIGLEISGGKFLKGSIIEMSNDIVVLFDGNDYLYIPFNHVQNLTLIKNYQDTMNEPSEPSLLDTDTDKKELTFPNILTQAQGIYTEIYVTGKTPIHGYISNIMNDYIVVQSPIYSSIYIASTHIKWLIPYYTNQTPYGLTEKVFTIKPYNELLPSTFAAQIEKMRDKLVVINLGEKENYIGKINNVKGPIVEIQTARTNQSYLNLSHIQTIHQM